MVAIEEKITSLTMVSEVDNFYYDELHQQLQQHREELRTGNKNCQQRRKRQFHYR